MLEIRGRRIERRDGKNQLNLTMSPVTDDDLARLQKTDLQVLGLSHAQHVTDKGLVHLKELHGLQELDLSHTQVGDAGLSHLQGVSSLQMLDVAFTRVADAGLAHLARLRSLRYLDVTGDNISPAGLTHLHPLLRMTEGTTQGGVPVQMVVGLTELLLTIPHPDEKWLNALAAFGSLGILCIQFGSSVSDRTTQWMGRLSDHIPGVTLRFAQ